LIIIELLTSGFVIEIVDYKTEPRLLCIRRAKIVDNNPSQDCCVYVEPKLLTITRNKKESQDYYYGYRKNETKQLAAPTSPFSLHFQNIIKQNIGCHPMASK
jgi:hypothetical protein